MKPAPSTSAVIPLADMFSAMLNGLQQENEIKDFEPCTGPTRFRGARISWMGRPGDHARPEHYVWRKYDDVWRKYNDV